MDNKKLVNFLYLLMRDTLPCGEVEKLTADTEKAHANSPGNFIYSNEFLWRYSRILAKRLTK